jgi:hypothetical protein
MDLEQYDKQVLADWYKETRGHAVLNKLILEALAGKPVKKRVRKKPPTEAQLRVQKEFAERSRARAAERRKQAAQVAEPEVVVEEVPPALPVEEPEEDLLSDLKF